MQSYQYLCVYGKGWVCMYTQLSLWWSIFTACVKDMPYTHTWCLLCLPTISIIFTTIWQIPYTRGWNKLFLYTWKHIQQRLEMIPQNNGIMHDLKIAWRFHEDFGSENLSKNIYQCHWTVTCLKASVCNFYQNFNIHTLRCEFLYICGSPPGVMMADTLSFNAKIGLVDFWV